MVECTAEAYGVTLSTFCFHALGMARGDRAALWFETPTNDVLARLSAGTGLSIEKLEDMSAANVQRRIKRACEEILATEQGRMIVATYVANNSAVLQNP